MSTPTSVRLPASLELRVRARAHLERRSFSNVLRVLVERGLDVPPTFEPTDDFDPGEVERLAAIARDALAEYRQ